MLTLYFSPKPVANFIAIQNEQLLYMAMQLRLNLYVCFEFTICLPITIKRTRIFPPTYLQLSTASRPILKPVRAGSGFRNTKPGYVAPAQTAPFPSAAAFSQSTDAFNQSAMAQASQGSAQATSRIFSPSGSYHTQGLAGSRHEPQAVDSNNDDMFRQTQGLAGSPHEPQADDSNNDDMSSGLSVAAPTEPANSGGLGGMQPVASTSSSAFGSYPAQQGYHNSSRPPGGGEVGNGGEAVGNGNMTAASASHMTTFQPASSPSDPFAIAMANAPAALGNTASSSMNPNRSFLPGSMPSTQGSAKGWSQASHDTGEDSGMATRRPIKKKTRGLKVGAYNDEGASAITATATAFQAQPLSQPSSQAGPQAQTAAANQQQPQRATAPQGTASVSAPTPAFAFGQQQNTPSAYVTQQATSFQPQPQPAPSQPQPQPAPSQPQAQPQPALSQWQRGAAPAPPASQQTTNQWPALAAASSQHTTAQWPAPATAASLQSAAQWPAPAAASSQQTTAQWPAPATAASLQSAAQWPASAAASSQQTTAQWPAPAAAAGQQAAPQWPPLATAPLSQQTTQPATYPWQQQRSSSTAPGMQAQPQRQWQVNTQNQNLGHQGSGGTPPLASGNQFLAQGSGPLQAPATGNQLQAHNSGALANGNPFQAQATGALQAHANGNQFQAQGSGPLQAPALGGQLQAQSSGALANGNPFQAQATGALQAHANGNQFQAQGSGPLQAPALGGQLQAQSSGALTSVNQFQAQGPGGLQAPATGNQPQAQDPGSFNTWQGNQALQQPSHQMLQPTSQAPPSYPQWQAQGAQPQTASAMHPTTQALGSIPGDLLTFSPQRPQSMQDPGASAAQPGQLAGALPAAAPPSFMSPANQSISEQSLQANSISGHEEPAHTFNTNNFTPAANTNNFTGSATASNCSSNQNTSFPSQSSAAGSNTVTRSHVAQTVAAFSALPTQMRAAPVPAPSAAAAASTITGVTRMRPSSGGLLSAAGVSSPAKLPHHANAILARGTPPTQVSHSHAAALISKYASKGEQASNTTQHSRPRPQVYSGNGPDTRAPQQQSQKDQAVTDSSFKRASEVAFGATVHAEVESIPAVPRVPESEAQKQLKARADAAVLSCQKHASSAASIGQAVECTETSPNMQTVESCSPETVDQLQSYLSRLSGPVGACQEAASSAVGQLCSHLKRQATEAMQKQRELSDQRRSTLAQLSASHDAVSGLQHQQGIAAEQEDFETAAAIDAQLQQLSAQYASLSDSVGQLEQLAAQQEQLQLGTLEAQSAAWQLLGQYLSQLRVWQDDRLGSLQAQAEQDMAQAKADYQQAELALQAVAGELAQQSAEISASRNGLEAQRSDVTAKADAERSQLIEKRDNLENDDLHQLLAQREKELSNYSPSPFFPLTPREIDDLHQLLAQREKELSSTKQQLNSSHTKVQELAASVRTQMTLLEQKNQGLSSQQAQLDSQMTLLEHKNQGLAYQQAQLDSQMTLLEHKNQGLTSQQARMDSQELAASVRIQTTLLEQKNQGLSSQQAQMDSQASTLALCRSQLDDQSASAARHHAAAAQKLDALSSASAECSNKVAAFTELVHRERENKLLRDKVGRVDQDAQEKLMGFEKYVEDLAAGVDDIVNKLSQLSAGLEESEARASQAMQLLPNLEAAKRDAAARKDFKEAARISAEAKGMQNDVEQHEALCQRHAAHVEQLSASQSEKEAELASLAPTLSELQLGAAQARFRYLKLLSQQQQREVQAAVHDQRFEDAQLLQASFEEEIAELERIQLEWNFSELPSPRQNLHGQGPSQSSQWGEGDHQATSADQLGRSTGSRAHSNGGAATSGGQGGVDRLSCEHDGAGGGRDRGGSAGGVGEWHQSYEANGARNETESSLDASERLAAETGVDSLWCENPLAMEDASGEQNSGDDADSLPQRDDRLGEVFQDGGGYVDGR
eukprot:gene16009-22147_t